MADEECVAFLQWALPRMGMRWAGFRKVRRQVCRRIRERMAELELGSYEDYRRHLTDSAAEWRTLGRLCRVTISRFFRDRGLFRRLGEEVMPELAAAARERGDRQLRCWSVGCASGEEPYGLALLWHLGAAGDLRDVELRVLATDVDVTVLARARRGLYESSSLRELPDATVERAFETRGDRRLLRPELRRGVLLAAHDVRRELPSSRFDLILCRNLLFTYFGEEEQRRTGERLLERLTPPGCLVLGSHESPPADLGGGLEQPWRHCYRAPSD